MCVSYIVHDIYYEIAQFSQWPHLQISPDCPGKVKKGRLPANYLHGQAQLLNKKKNTSQVTQVLLLNVSHKIHQGFDTPGLKLEPGPWVTRAITGSLGGITPVARAISLSLSLSRTQWRIKRLDIDIDIDIYIYIVCVCMYMYVCARVCVCVWLCMCGSACGIMYVWVRVWVFVCVCVGVCVCVFRYFSYCSCDLIRQFVNTIMYPYESVNVGLPQT